MFNQILTNLSFCVVKSNHFVFFRHVQCNLLSVVKLVSDVFKVSFSQ